MTRIGSGSGRIAASVIGGGVLVPGTIFTIPISGTQPAFADPPAGDPTFIPPGGQAVEIVTPTADFEAEGETFGPYPASALGSTTIMFIVTARLEVVGGGACPAPSNTRYEFGIRTSSGGQGFGILQTGSGSAGCIGPGGTTSVLAPVTSIGQNTLLNGPTWREFIHGVRIPRNGTETWRPFLRGIFVGALSTSIAFTVSYLAFP